jgi:exodeoxyribonuclease III
VLSLLTLNVGATALPRAEAIGNWLAAREDDVVILTETSGGPGTAYLCDRFRRAGWHVEHRPEPADRGAALVSRVAVLPSDTADFDDISIPGRVATATLDTEPQVTVIGTYVPSRDRSAGKTDKKRQFIESLVAAIDAMPAERREHTILGGDYNVIARDHEPRHPGFLPFEYGLIDALRRHEFADAHTVLHPGEAAHSWIGRTGDGYCYDYFHLGKALAGRTIGSCYLHDTRNRRLSDHAAVTTTLDIAVNTRRIRAWSTADEQTTLF